MKKTALIIALALISSMILSACSEENTDPVLVSGGSQASEVASDTADTEQETGITYEGVFIAPGLEAEGVISSIDAEYDFYEGASCAYVGMDKTYDYGFMAIYTYDEGDGEYISIIEVRDDVIDCNGIRIGDPADDVIKALGEPTNTYEGGISYTMDDTVIQYVTDEDGTVTSIMYSEAE